MMEIHTSYYGHVVHVDTTNYLLVQVSNTCPKWFGKPTVSLPDMHPQWKIVSDYNKGLIDADTYECLYRADLTTAKVTAARELLERSLRASGKSKAIFLCYEGKNNFCHRHMAAEIVAGHPCPELN